MAREGVLLLRGNGGRAGSSSFLLALLVAILPMLGCAAARPQGFYQADFADPVVQNVGLELVSLAEHMDNPKSMGDLRMGMIYSSDVNAANAGGGIFYFTDGLVQMGDPHLVRGVIAHELAHDDMHHLAKGVAVSPPTLP